MTPIKLSMRNVRYIVSVLTIDDPEKYEGGPVGLQIIGRRYEEEKVLDILEVVAQVIGKVE